MRRGWPVLGHFWRLYTQIKNITDTGGNVYIHCRAGAHRAGTVTTGFGMLCFHFSVDDALAYVSNRRRVTQIDGDNKTLLRILDQEIKEAYAAAPAARYFQVLGTQRQWSPKAPTPASASASASASTAPAVAAAPAASASASASTAPAVVAPAIPKEEPQQLETSATPATVPDEEVDYAGSEDEELAPAIPRNEPEQDEKFATPPSVPDAEEVRQSRQEHITIPTTEEAEQRQQQENSEWASLRVSSSTQPHTENQEEPSAAPAASSELAAPRRDRKDGRIAYREAAAHMSFMSWNAGGGAKKIASVIEEVGNHIVAIQEANEKQLEAPFSAGGIFSRPLQRLRRPLHRAHILYKTIQ
jgi:hypothetical protein